MKKSLGTALAFIAVLSWLVVLMGASVGMYAKDPTTVPLLLVWMAITVLMHDPIKHCFRVLIGAPEKKAPPLTGIDFYLGMMRKLEPGTPVYATAVECLNFQLMGVYLDQLTQLVKDGPVRWNELTSNSATHQLIAWGLAKTSAGDDFAVATSYGVDVVNAERLAA